MLSENINDEKRIISSNQKMKESEVKQMSSSDLMSAK